MNTATSFHNFFHNFFLVQYYLGFEVQVHPLPKPEPTKRLLKRNIVRCYSELKPNVPTRNCIGSLCSQDLCK